MKYEINTKSDYLHMEEFNNWGLTTGKIILQW